VWEDPTGYIIINLYPYFNTFYVDWSNYDEDIFGMPMPEFTHMEDLYFDADSKYFSATVYPGVSGTEGLYSMTMYLTFDDEFNYMTEGWLNAAYTDGTSADYNIATDMGAQIYYSEEAECYDDDYWYSPQSWSESDLWMYYGNDCLTFAIDYEG